VIPTRRVLIADDEAPARARIRALLANQQEYDIIGESDSGPTTLDAIRSGRPDITFLDVQMPGMTGFEVLERLQGDPPPIIIFTTAYEQYALAAFRASAIDYLLKPYTDERFQDALTRAQQVLRGRAAGDWQQRLTQLMRLVEAPESSRDPHASRIKRFAARHGDRIVVVGTAEVDWVEARRDWVVLHAGASRHLVRMSMQELEERLDPEEFIRIHRSTVVRIDRIAALEPIANAEDAVLMRDGMKLRVSRAYRREVRRRMGLA
jgi:two-component system LytT family response regulator